MAYTNIEKDGDRLTVFPESRLDTATAPRLKEELTPHLEGIQDVLMDFEHVEYISSAGLRVLLSAQKMMNKQGSMIILNTRPEIMDIFEITGFTDILNIQ